MRLYLSAAVMTHQRRYSMARELRDSFPDLNLRICTDTGEPGEAGSLRSASLAWAAVEPGATHHMVVQDDVHLPAAMGEVLRPLLTSKPDAVICLFVEWGAWSASAARIAALTGSGWVEVVDEYIPSQAIVMPADLAREADAYLNAALQRGEPDDWALSGYLRSVGVVPVLAVPNLVEHDSGASLTGNDHHGLRRSVCWMPGAATAESLDREITDLDYVPSMSYAYSPGKQPGALVVPAPGAQPSLDEDAPADKGAHFWIRDQRPGHWRKAPAWPVLDRIGLRVAELRALSGEALERFPGRVEATRMLGEYLLTDFWVAAFSLGLRAAQVATGLPLRYDTPVARQALSTMVLGAFRNVLPRTQYIAATELLTPLVEETVRFGEAWARANADQLRVHPVPAA